jgi:hypothetical protein
MLHLIGLIVVIWLGYILIVGLYECFVDAVAKKIIDSDRLRTMRRDHSLGLSEEERLQKQLWAMLNDPSQTDDQVHQQLRYFRASRQKVRASDVLR